jgi:hypothetical protein
LRLLVRMMKPSVRKGRGWRDDYVTFECAVKRLIGPVQKMRGHADFIYADIDLPEQYREHALNCWNANGTYRVEVVINHNAKTLAPFLASGDVEWILTEE